MDATAAGQAYTALATVEELLKDWDEGGPAVLRAGGLSVRDLKRTAVALDVPEPVAAFWVELAYAAGLLASDGEADERYAPTPAYDDWLERPAAERWARPGHGLADGDPHGRAGRRPGRQGPHALRARPGPGPLGRARGTAPGAGPARRAARGRRARPPEAVLARLRWERPLRGPERGRRGRPAHPARPLGAVRGGAAGRHRPGRAVGARPGPAGRARGSPRRGRKRTRRAAATSSPSTTVTAPPPLTALSPAEQAAAAAAAARLLAPLLPEPLDHVLLQADLTAVAPGPLQRPLAGPARGARGRGVQGRGDRLPVHARLGTACAGRRADRRRPARLPRRSTPAPRCRSRSRT